METEFPTVTCHGRRIKLEPAHPIPKPTRCPACDHPVAQRQNIDGESGVMLCCSNANCPARQIGKIKTWIKKLDIQGLGDVFIEKLCVIEKPNRVLSSAADLYRFAQFPWRHHILVHVLGESRAAKVENQIAEKRELTLPQFLGSLGIDGLGRRRVAIVQGKCPGQFDTLGDWTSGKLVAMAEAAGLPRAAKNIYEQIRANTTLIDDLLDVGVTIKSATPVAPKKANAMTICITGKLTEGKAYYYDLAQKAGHQTTDTFNKEVTHLVAADPKSGSAKLVKAAKLGVKVISERELLDLLK